MPQYSQYSPWTDAANYGQGFGQSLSQGMLQLPQERFALAQQQAQMILRSQLAQQGLQQRGQYNEGRLENQRQGLDQRAQNADMMQKLQELGMQLKMQQAQQPRVEGGYLIPGLGQENTNAVGGQSPNQMQGVQPQATMGQQQGLPYGIQQLPRQATPINPNEQQKNIIEQQKLYMNGLYNSGQTNVFKADPNLQTLLSNQVYGVQGQVPQQGQGLPQQGVQQQPQGQGVKIRDKVSGQTFNYGGNPADVPTNQYDILQ